MRILLFGGCGVIGSPLSVELGKRHEVIVSDIVKDAPYLCDITYGDQVDRLVSDIRPDVSVLLAAEVSRLSSEECPSKAINTNVLGCYNVVNSVMRYGGELVYIGTSEEYGRAYDSDYSVDEDMGCEPINMYGLTKHFATRMLWYYHQYYGLHVRIPRVFMCYGPGEYPNKYRSMLIRMIDDIYNGREMVIHTGTVRQWCYIDDVVNGIIKVIEYDSIWDIFNIGKSEFVTTQELMSIIAELLGLEPRYKLVECPDRVVARKVGNFDKARNVLGFEARIGLMEGLKRTIDWYVNEST